MDFFQVRQYTKFPIKDLRVDKIIKSFESLKEAEEFSVAYNIQKDSSGKYIVPSDKGYYVCVVKNPEF